MALHETSFDGVTPKKQAVQTPNVVLGTPFRTPSQSGSGSTPARITTPRLGTGMGPAGSMTPGQTPVRDQLNINPDDSLESYEAVKSLKQQQLEMRAQLRAGLSGLPVPKNDFEIVVPEDDAGGDEETTGVDPNFVEDASEIEERKARAKRAEGRYKHCVT